MPHLFQRLASHIVFAGGALRAEPAVLAGNQLGQPGLWRFGISGDRPIVLARIATADQIPLARQLLAAHAYLRLRGLEFDLVLLDEESGSYLDELNRQLLETVRSAGSLERVDQPGGVFVRKASQMSEDERMLLQAAARVVLVGDRGSLASQLDRTERYAPLPARLVATREPAAWPDEPVELPADLLFFNGLGGFTADGREYCVLVQGPPPPDIGRNGPVAHHPAPAHPAAPPCPVGQRHRQSALRLRRLRGRLGVHLGRQQPVQPPHHLEQRPGLRPARRGRLPARRGDRRGLVARPRCRSPPASRRSSDTAGLHRLRAEHARAGPRADACSSRSRTRSS